MRTDFCSCGIYLNKTSIEGAALPFGALRKLNINIMNHFSSRLLAPDSESSILPLMESHCFRHKKKIISLAQSLATYSYFLFPLKIFK